VTGSEILHNQHFSYLAPIVHAKQQRLSQSSVDEIIIDLNHRLIWCRL